MGARPPGHDHMGVSWKISLYAHYHTVRSTWGLCQLERTSMCISYIQILTGSGLDGRHSRNVPQRRGIRFVLTWRLSSFFLFFFLSFFLSSLLSFLLGPMGMAFSWRGCYLRTILSVGRRSPPLRTWGYVILWENRVAQLVARSTPD